MAYLTIEGGRPLHGRITIQCAKNSVLPVLAATLLAADTCRLVACPHLSDVETAAEILRHLGCTARWEGEDLVVDTTHVVRCDIPETLMRKMRSSVIFLGAILSRCSQAELSYPGGCELGPRPIDLHLTALRTLGAEINEVGGSLLCRAHHLQGTDIVLTLPSVGATENAILAACGAQGVTVISNAAREPEIGDLQSFLQKLGVAIHGAGTSSITVHGCKTPHGCTHRCIGDRIAAATYLCAAAGSGGRITLDGIDYRHLATVTTALHQSGCRIQCGADTITLESDGPLRSIAPVRTSPYPGFPTDAQAPLMAALLRSTGATMFVENMFDSRYRHVPELLRMGADIRLEGRVAVICGVSKLHGATVHATDLRGGAALVIAALQTRDTTQIHDIYHIQRGYQDLAGDLTALGASVSAADV